MNFLIFIVREVSVNFSFHFLDNLIFNILCDDIMLKDSMGKISSVLFIVIYVAIDSTIMPLGHGYSYTYLPNSFLMKGERVQGLYLYWPLG